MDDESIAAQIAGIGERLRALRTERNVTLRQLSDSTGVSSSTLSRLEAGKRRANLDLILPIARALSVPLDELIGQPTGDPRVRQTARTVCGRTLIPLSQVPGNRRTYKMIIQPTEETPQQRRHDGYEWMYVLSGRLRLLLGDRDIQLTTGEAAEFDTRVPHWFGCGGSMPVELLTIFSEQGERVHMKAKN